MLMPEGLQEGRAPRFHQASPHLWPPPTSLPCSRDLKRDVAKKLEKLEKRTQRAIAELIRKCGAGSLPCGWWPKHMAPLHSSCLPPIQVRG